MKKRDILNGTLAFNLAFTSAMAAVKSAAASPEQPPIATPYIEPCAPFGRNHSCHVDPAEGAWTISTDNSIPNSRSNWEYTKKKW